MGTNTINDDIDRYITNSSFSSEEKNKIREDVKRNSLSIEQVQKLYPSTSSNKKLSFEDGIKSVVDDPDISIDDAIVKMQKDYPGKTKNSIISALANSYSDDPEMYAEIKSYSWSDALKSGK